MTNSILKVVFSLEVGHDSETGLLRWQTTRLNGKLHSAPDGRPAHIVYDDAGNPIEMAWFYKDRYHRVGAPALIKLNPDNGVHIYEEYRCFGEMHRSHSEPALISRDPINGDVKSTAFYVDGKEINPVPPNLLDPAP